MFSVSLRSGHCLMFVVLLAPVLVQPDGLKFEDNEWTSTDAKRDRSTFDKAKALDANAKTQASKPATAITDTTDDRSLRLLNATDLSVADTAVTDEAVSDGDSGRIWGVVASLCVAGVGLAGLGYYRSHARHMASW